MKRHTFSSIPFHKILLTGILFLLLFSGMKCEKDANEPDSLPPITQEGRNTFGCLINEKVFLPKGSGTNIIKEITRSGDNYFIRITNNNLGSIIFDFDVTSTGSKVNCIRYSDYTNNCIYDLCPPSNHTLIISRLDLNQKIISGTFSSSLPANSACGSISITEGRFDLSFK